MRIGAHTFSGRVDDVKRTLDEAAVRDDDAEARVKRYTWIAVASGFLMVFSFMFAIGTEQAWLGGLGCLLGTSLATCVVLIAVHTRHDLDDRKLDGVRHLLGMLRADIPRAAPLSLEVDFRPANTLKPVSSSGGWTGPREKTFSQAWLKLKAPLADGNRLLLAVSEDVKRKEKPKRKTTKVRERTLSRLTLVLRLHKRYGAAEAIAPVLPPEVGSWRVVRVQGQGRLLKAVLVSPRASYFSARGSETRSGYETLATGPTLVAALRWIYRGLARARSAAA